MREADFGCTPYDACYTSTSIGWDAWSWPELFLVVIAAAFLLALLWAILTPPEKPKPSIKTAVTTILNDLEKQADIWKRPEARDAFVEARRRIDIEFNDRKIT